jgi:hypothetical protein
VHLNSFVDFAIVHMIFWNWFRCNQSAEVFCEYIRDSDVPFSALWLAHQLRHMVTILVRDLYQSAIIACLIHKKCSCTRLNTALRMCAPRTTGFDSFQYADAEAESAAHPPDGGGRVDKLEALSGLR